MSLQENHSRYGNGRCYDPGGRCNDPNDERVERMSRLLYRVGKFCAAHRKSVAATWLGAVAAIAVAPIAIGAQTSDDLTLPGTGSTNATDLLQQKLPEKANGTVPIVLRSSQGRLDSGANKKAIDDTVKSLKRN